MATHQFLDDDPSGTLSDTFNVNVRLSDDDGGVDTEQVSLTVVNVAPVIDTLSITSPINENGMATLSGTFTDPGSLDTFELDIDWDGDSTFDETIVVSGGSFMATHQFLDDDPSGTLSDTFNVNVRLSDDDGGEAIDSVSLTVENVAPTVTVAANQIVDEGTLLDLTGGGLGAFADPGTLDTHTATVDWGDGTSIEPVAVNQMSGSGSLSASHTFADDGMYTVTVTVIDDDGGSAMQQFTVTVNNVAPTMAAVPNITTDEGTFISLPPATFTDPGFDLTAAGTEENFTATIDWGDGTTEPVGDITLTEVPGSEGVLTTGTIAMHAYADDGIHRDCDGDRRRPFTVTVNNVAPTMAAVPNITTDEGTFISLPPATFTDPGFDLTVAGTEESFTATIDWGDGTTEPVGDITLTEVPGSEGILTTGTINAMHAYADDGMYTVTVTVMDDDGGSAMQQFTVTVNNVAPTMAAVPNITTDEGTFISLPPATFTDPGFDLTAVRKRASQPRSIGAMARRSPSAISPSPKSPAAKAYSRQVRSTPCMHSHDRLGRWHDGARRRYHPHRSPRQRRHTHDRYDQRHACLCRRWHVHRDCDGDGRRWGQCDAAVHGNCEQRRAFLNGYGWGFAGR